MNVKHTLLLVALLTGTLTALFGQAVPKDVTIPLTATVNANNSITLNWPNPVASNLQIIRHTKGNPNSIWVIVLSVNNSTQTTVTDNLVSPGQTYEYRIQRNTTFSAFGYVHVAINAPVTDNRGKILMFVDSTTADALGVELVQMKNDMRGDGWIAVPIKVGPAATVQSVKNQIVAAYNADPGNVKAVFLIGHVPIPYSGDATAWDGHTDHHGAWPADAYYADINGIWTDNITNTTPGRAANKNLPGDGKFDQDYIPADASNNTDVELQVGRLDFRRLTQATFGLNEIELLRRYLNKNHRWRTKQYVVQNKALVDDNFGVLGGVEPFAANGFRNAYPLVGGGANVVEADFFNGTETQSYLMGYGCGGGNYTSAANVGSSTNFGADSVNIVFTNLFGSYFGDWDYETDPFMPSALASRGGILTCGWAGRPHWFLQAMASGETIGYCMKETQNANTNIGYIGTYGESGAHVALLGDPTLRAHVVAPPSVVTVSANCATVSVQWTASADASVIGYHVYRSLSNDGPYTRLTANVITGTSYEDTAPVLDTLFYQARAIKQENAPGGGLYLNNSVGPISWLVYTPPPAPAVTIPAAEITCSTPSPMLSANSTPAGTAYQWSGPGGFTSTNASVSANAAGNYQVVVTFADGCTSSATTALTENTTLPTVTALVNGSLDCIQQSVTISISADVPVTIETNGPGGFTATGPEIMVNMPGAYTVIAIANSNGCTGVTTAFVSLNTTPPLAFASGGVLTCANLSVTLSGSSNVPGSSYLWTGPNGFTSTLQNPTTSTAGIYQLAVTASNGCSSTATTTVTSNTTPPLAFNIPPQLSYDCNTPCVSLLVPPVPGYSFELDNEPVLPGQLITICNAGNYTITVRSDANGCTDDYNLEILANVAEPGVVAGGSGNQITCSNPSVPVTANSAAPGVTYFWSGPGGFASNQQNPLVSTAGIYTVTAIGTNGCTSTAEVTITQDGSVPTATATGGKITCSAPALSLLSASNTPGITFAWTGPNGFTSALQNPVVSVAGTYVLVVEAPNGCTATVQVQVTADVDGPSIFLPNIETLDCNTPCITVQATSGTSGVTIAPVQICIPGDYTITATNPANGCTSVAAFPVTQNNTQPNISLPLIGQLDCNTPCVTIQATSSTPGVVISPVLACDGGPFTIVATDPANGCTSSATFNVPVAPPLVVVPGPTLTNCDNIVIGVNVSGGTPPYQYLWSTGATTPQITLTTTATVAVVVSDGGGCVFESVPVTITPPAPILVSLTSVAESAPGAGDGSIALNVAGGTAPYTYLWSNGATTPGISGLNGGVYTVTATDAAGCQSAVTITVQTMVGTDEAGLFSQLNLSPNPTEGPAVLQMRLFEPATVGISVFDATGRLVWEKPSFTVFETSVAIDMSGQPQGMYTVSIRVGNQVVTRKLAVLR